MDIRHPRYRRGSRAPTVRRIPAQGWPAAGLPWVYPIKMTRRPIGGARKRALSYASDSTRVVSFQDEFRELLVRYEVEHNEGYIWD